MLVGHLVPGYFAVTMSQANPQPDCQPWRRVALWAVALGATVLPDLDVILNILLRGSLYHSVVWTHSLFLWLGLGLVWWLLRHLRKWRYVKIVVGLIALGGLSHLVLDVVAHGTPLFYPVSMKAVSLAPQRVVEFGLWAYVTDPVVLLEPVLVGCATHHWLSRRPWHRSARMIAIAGLWAGITASCGLFLHYLPSIQRAASAAVWS